MHASLLLVAACSQLDVGLGPADTGTTGVTSQTTTSSSTTGTTESSGVDTSSTTSSGGASTSSGDGTGSSSSGGDTEGLEESPCQSEQKVCAEVELDGAPVGFCGQTLVLHGATQPLDAGRWSVEDCDGCEPCGGPLYEVQLAGPAGWLPSELPSCTRIAIDFAPLDDSPFPCAFTGAAIWDELDGSAGDPAPVWVAASIVTDPPAALDGLVVAAENVAPKSCAELDCCWQEPGKYVLAFSGAAIGAPLELAEHEDVLGITAFSQPYDLRNERSHAHEPCDQIPHFDWILRR